MDISIKINNIQWLAELNDSKTAELIYNSLPLNGSVNRWGDEIYFMIPVKADLEKDAKEEVNEGDLAYWPSGPAFCIFFGKTPVSSSDKPKAYSPVNVFGKIQNDLELLKKVNNNDKIIINKI